MREEIETARFRFCAEAGVRQGQEGRTRCRWSLEAEEELPVGYRRLAKPKVEVETDHDTLESPRNRATGNRLTFVEGVPVGSDGECTGTLRGRVLRREAPPASFPLHSPDRTTIAPETQRIATAAATTPRRSPPDEERTPHSGSRGTGRDQTGSGSGG